MSIAGDAGASLDRLEDADKATILIVLPRSDLEAYPMIMSRIKRQKMEEILARCLAMLRAN